MKTTDLGLLSLQPEVLCVHQLRLEVPVGRLQDVNLLLDARLLAIAAVELGMAAVDVGLHSVVILPVSSSGHLLGDV